MEAISQSEILLEATVDNTNAKQKTSLEVPWLRPGCYKLFKMKNNGPEAKQVSSTVVPCRSSRLVGVVVNTGASTNKYTTIM
jgi:hypothetical protein